jgi:hypothetical protein
MDELIPALTARFGYVDLQHRVPVRFWPHPWRVKVQVPNKPQETLVAYGPTLREALINLNALVK